MKKYLALVFGLTVGIGLFVLAAYGSSKSPFKVGDKVFVCNCGETCPCGTISKKEGKCGCGMDLVEGKVTKAEKGILTVAVGDKTLSFKTSDVYACSCGSKCDCYTISQKPGKCGCGKDLVKK